MSDETVDQATDRIVDVFRNAGRKVKQNGVGYEVSCPGPIHARGDRNPSLSINPGTKAVVVHCHTGDPTRVVLAEINLTEADLFPRNGKTSKWDPVVARYSYVDEEGRPLFRVNRTSGKDFWQERYDNGIWKTKLEDTRRVLYHLDEVTRETDRVWVVEGEKDADRLRSAGLVATCNPMGAAKPGQKPKWRPEYSDQLAHVANATVVADRDDAGQAHAQAIATSLEAAGVNVEVVQPPEGFKDTSDMLNGGLTLEDLEPLDDDGDGSQPEVGAFEFLTLAEMGRRVDEAGPRHYLIRGIWPADAYGVLAGPMKAQKTMTMADEAVSVASGTPWLDHFPIDAPGPVLMFAGEGGAASIVRRLRAVCDSRDLDPDSLPIHICTRAPHLRDDDHMGIFAAKVGEIRPKLVILDPLYLSAAGAKSSDLYGMGELLERAQLICDMANTALKVVTHFNRGNRVGAERITGAGPAEWGRVLIGVDVKSRHTDPVTKETTVVTAFDVIGGEVPDQSWRVKRRIVADDPDSLDSPLRYAVEVFESDQTSPEDDMSPARRKLVEAVYALGLPGSTGRELVDWIADKHGHGLYRSTVSTELNAARDDGLVDCIESPGKPTIWMPSQGVGGVAKLEATPPSEDDTLNLSPTQDDTPTRKGAKPQVEGVVSSETTPRRHPPTGDRGGVSSSLSLSGGDDTRRHPNPPPQTSHGQDQNQCPECRMGDGRHGYACSQLPDPFETKGTS